MGVESAVYRYVPASGESALLREALIEAGAEVVKDDELVLRGPSHWIDVQLDRPAPSVGLRVAFSNPVGVAGELRRVLAILSGTGRGEVVDPATRARIPSDDDTQIGELLAAFERRREAFQRDYGPFEASVSGGDVFRLMRERRGGA